MSGRFLLLVIYVNTSVTNRGETHSDSDSNDSAAAAAAAGGGTA
jgi:hypothetical protein